MFSANTINYIIIAYGVWNLFVFMIYGIDKNKAKKGKWRVKERTLLLMGFLFGGIGQIAAMRFFHHKTHKLYFVFSGILSIALQVFLIIMILKKLYLY